MDGWMDEWMMDELIVVYMDGMVEGWMDRGMDDG